MEEWQPHDVPPLPEQVGRQAIQIFRSLVAQDPSDPFADDLVWALWRVARYLAHDEALADVNEAVVIGEQLVQEYPASVEFRRELANALNVKSMVLLHPLKPTPQTAAQAMPFCRRGLELDEALYADLKSNRPEVLQPERPAADEARIVGDSPMWAEFDVALKSGFLANIYAVQGDWRHAAELDDQSTSIYKDLVEHSPSVATFTQGLASAFQRRVHAAEQGNDGQQAAAWSKDAVAFWNHQVELHPDLPALKDFVDEASKQSAKAAQWMWLPAPASTQPASTQP